MKTFLEYLTELFEPSDVSFINAHIDTTDNLEVYFKVDNYNFIVAFTGSNDNVWEVVFKYDDKNNPQSKTAFFQQHFNAGIQFRVLAKLLGFILLFLKERAPYELLFSASKEYNKDTRAKVYLKMMQRSTLKFKELGYNWTNSQLSQDFVQFIITKESPLAPNK